MPIPSSHSASARPGPGEALLAAEVLESDFRYFECAALTEELGGAIVAYMPGLEDVAAGCVVQRVDPAALPQDADAWLIAVERRLFALGCRRPRFYLQQEIPRLEAALRAHGYASRTELAHLDAKLAPRAASNLSLRPVVTEADWARKLELHEACGDGPDGYKTPPARWVELERKKAETGEFEPLLMMAGDEVCGTLAVMEFEHVLRLKNVVVHPGRRNQGIAAKALHRGCELAARRGKAAAGIFSIVGGIAGPIYTRCGLLPVAQQTEWVRENPTPPRH